MQTEAKCGNGSNDWKYAFSTARDMIYYFNNGASSFMQWNMILDHTGDSTWGWKQSAMITVNTDKAEFSYNPQFYMVKHFANLVKTGAKLLPLNSDTSVAFLNPDGSVAVVIINDTNQKKPVSLEINGKIYSLEISENSINTVIYQ